MKLTIICLNFFKLYNCSNKLYQKVEFNESNHHNASKRPSVELEAISELLLILKFKCYHLIR